LPLIFEVLEAAHIAAWPSKAGDIQLLKRVEKSCDPILTLPVVFREGPNQHADPAYGLSRLRVPSKWPGSGNATDKRDEFAPSHFVPEARVECPACPLWSTAEETFWAAQTITPNSNRSERQQGFTTENSSNPDRSPEV
jgi:hypothetical protein